MRTVMAARLSGMERETQPVDGMEWTEGGVGEYLAAVLFDSSKHPLVGDPLRGFGPFDKVTPLILEAFRARTTELEVARRNFLKTSKEHLTIRKRNNMYAK